jgi:TatD DNase family protein
MILDIHTHSAGRPDSVLSLPPAEVLGLPSAAKQLYSLSLHPWYVTRAMMADFERVVSERAEDSRWVAVGECGLDPLCETAPALQLEALLLSLGTAKTLGKPTVLHCVRRWDDLQATVRRVWGQQGAAEAFRHGAPLIIHGYRKGKALAQSLIKQGFCLSLGEHFQPEVGRLVPPERLYMETDESPLPIAEIRRRVEAARRGE